MSSPINSILRAATRKGEPLNILLFTTNEEYENLLCNTGHNFFALNKRGQRWRNDVCLIPENYTEINSIVKNNITFDSILCLNRNHSYKECKIISKQLHIPLIIAELEYPSKIEGELQNGDINIFVEEKQAEAWGFKRYFKLINNCIDESKLNFSLENKENTILTIENDWRKKPYHGLNIHYKIFNDKKMPIKIYGDNPGISKPLHWQEECVAYSTSNIYVNTSIRVPQPTQILKAMYSGAVVITLDNCGIDKIVKHKKNGLLVDENHLEYFLKYINLCNEKDWIKNLRKEAHQNILNNHSSKNFVKNWNEIFDQIQNTIFTGK